MNLSSEERQTLESIARKYASPYRDVIRAKIVLLTVEGLSNDGKVELSTLRIGFASQALN